MTQLEAPLHPQPLAPGRRAIRVSFLIDDLSRAGTETQLLALIRTLDRDAIEPSLVLLNGEGAESRALEPTDCPILRLGVTRLLSGKAIAAAKQLRSYWRERRPDIAQIYFNDSAYFGVPVAKLAGVKTVVRVRNNLGYWQTGRHRLLGRLIRPWVDVVLTNSTDGRDAIVRMDRIKPDRVQVIENGVDLDRFRIDAPLPSGRGELRVGTVANLRAVKNIDGLMRAAKRVLARVPDATFEVAGDGEERSNLEQLHRELGLGERFLLRGPVTDVPAFLASLDLAVLPSHSEGMSNAVLEYMAAGLPVVATDVGANRKLLADGGCGVLVPPGDESALADAISKLLDDPHRTRLGSAACRRVERHYSRDAMRRKFEDFYRRLVPSNPTLPE